jgi:MFS family permease
VRLGVDDTTLSLIWACYILGVVIALLAAPPLSTRFGAKPVIISGLAVALLGCLLLAFSGMTLTTSAGRFCAGIGTGIAASAGISGVLSLGVGALTRLAVSVASGSTLVGAALGAATSSLAVLTEQPDLVMFTTAAAIVAAAIASAAVTPYREAQAPTDEGTAPGAARPGSVLPVILLQVCVGAPAGVMLALGPVIFERVSGGDAGARVGILSVALFGGTFVGQLVAQGMSVPIRRVSALVLTVLCCVLGALAVPAGAAGFIVGAAAATGIGSAIGQMAVFAEFRAVRVGAALTAATSIGFLASYAMNGALPIAMGALSDATGDYGLAMVVLLGVIGVLVIAAESAAFRARRANEEPD